MSDGVEQNYSLEEGLKIVDESYVKKIIYYLNTNKLDTNH